jgi:hypothetical protein
MKSAVLRFGPLMLLLIMNTLLLVRIHSDTRKQSAEWQRLEADADQKIERLKALAAEVGQASGKLKGQADSLRSQADALSNLVHAHDKSPSACAIIHKPASGCPKGYTQEKRPYFTEKDGSKEFACLAADPSKESCVDVLKAGESLEMHLMIPVPEPESPAQPKI